MSVVRMIAAMGLTVGAGVVGVQGFGGCSIDPDRYHGLRIGQSYDEVVAILGCPGEAQGATRRDLVRYAWSGGGLGGAQVSLLFDRGVMVSRSINSIAPIATAQSL